MAMFFGKRGEETRDKQKVIGEDDVRRGIDLLAKYKAGKQRLEDRIVENEKWWKLQHWDVMRKEEGQLQNATAWLFSMLTSKHADAMDNFPEPVVLPRELSDKDAAKTLSQVLPVVLENCGYHNVYSMQWWEKLKSGTGVYGGFWDQSIDNGLGDVTVTGLDLLNLFWEPGISHIQKTRNLFITALWDNDILEETFPDAEGKVRGDAIDVKKYIHDENIDVSEKTVVVDWYYRTKSPSGKKVIHLIKFAAGVLLYASENDPQFADTGWIADDKYPVEFDVLFPEKDMPTGFGFVDILRNPQEYVDRIFSHIIESSVIGTKKRYLASKSTNINVEQFKNIEEPIVEVEGEISDARIKEIVPTPVNGIYLNVVQMMIDTMKDTSSNRDVNNGSASGATAAAAIAALQEAGNKQSRDMIDASYRAQENVYRMCLERMRQHYDETRSFRITGGTPEGYEFVSLDPKSIRDQVTGVDADGNETYRHPIFDFKVKAQKKNPFSRMEQNERAKELYGLGFFNPERAQEATICIGMMDFEGKDEILEQIKQGQTLLNICQQQQQQLAQMQAMLAALTGGMAREPQNLPIGGGDSAPQSSPAGGDIVPESRLANSVMQAHTPMTSYGEALAKRSTPSLEPAV